MNIWNRVLIITLVDFNEQIGRENNFKPTDENLSLHQVRIIMVLE
jgi:hypothetical protein